MALVNIFRRSTAFFRPTLPLARIFFSSAADSAAVICPLTQTLLTNQIFPPHGRACNSSLGDSEPEFSKVNTDFTDPEFYKFLQLVSDVKLKSGTRQEALELFRSMCEIEPTFDLVRSALWELRNQWETAVMVFRWGGDCAWDCEDARNLMLWILGKNKKFDLAWSLIRTMRKKSVLTKEAMIILMDRYAAANEVSKAIKTFDSVEMFNIEADSTTFYSLLRALCKHGNVEDAEELLLLRRKYFPLIAEGFNIILDCWCNEIVDVAEAKRIWREMSNYCIMPDGTSYSHLINCFSIVGNLFDSLRLFDEMKKRGWTPGIGTYNALIYVLSKENCFKEARGVFDKIIEAGLEPDEKTYNSMIIPLCEGNRLEEAHKVMDDMVKKGISPNCETYHALLKVEDLDGTLKTIELMRSAGVSPTCYTFTLVIDKFIRLNECGNALKMWVEMRRNDITPDSSHYIILVQGLIKQGWIPKAMELYNEMKSEGFSADPQIENIFKSFTSSVRDHWTRGGREYKTACNRMKHSYSS